MCTISVQAETTVWRRAKSADHAYPIALPVRGDAARPHDQCARLRPVKKSVRAIRGAGQLRRRTVERPRRVWVARLHAQGVGRVDRSVPLDAERAYVLGAAPASSRSVPLIARLDARGAGQVRHRPRERPRRVRVGRPHAQGVGGCREEDGASGCPAPFTQNECQDGRASHRRVPLAMLVCFVSASRWHGM